MDRLLLGDNPFFGINHMSEEKARSQAMRFPDAEAIIRALDRAYEAGIRTFMCTTHQAMQQICDHFRSQPDRYAGWSFYPCLPYAHKYADLVTEVGYVGALKKLAPGAVVGTLVRGAVAALTQDIMGAFDVLIDTELRQFAGLSVPVVFLNNIATDMALGLGAKEALQRFSRRVKDKHGAVPGFITMNLPLLVAALMESGISEAVVCSPFNKGAFRMNPSQEACERAVQSMPYRGVAMSVLASGAIPVREALDYVRRFDRIESIVVGASSREHVVELKRLLNGEAISAE